MGVAGMKLQFNSRTVGKEAKNDTGVTPPRPVSAKVSINRTLDSCSHYIMQQSRVISHTVKEGCVPVFKEWLDTANSDGNHTANMIHQ